jgi:hypothetical protein
MGYVREARAPRRASRLVRSCRPRRCDYIERCGTERGVSETRPIDSSLVVSFISTSASLLSSHQPSMGSLRTTHHRFCRSSALTATHLPLCSKAEADVPEGSSD